MAEDEVKIEYGDNQNPLDELRKRVEDLEMSLGVFNPRNMAGLRGKDLRQATRANLFGDGSDGDVVISNSQSLSRDMYYKNLTIESGGNLRTNSYRVFVKGDLIIKNGGKIHNDGYNGVNGDDGTQGIFEGGNQIKGRGGSGGAGGQAVPSGSFVGCPAGFTGTTGGDGVFSFVPGGYNGLSASNASNGASISKGLGAAGVGGSGGGSGGGCSGSYFPAGGAGGNGGNGGSITDTVINIPRNYVNAYFLIDTVPSFTNLGSSAQNGGSGGGGGGAINNTSNGSGLSGGGGGAGGAGSAGGILWIAANRIVNDGTISSNGGNGGNGGNGANGIVDGSNAAAGGGGGGAGGAGGAGGVVVLIYGEKSGSGSVEVKGGTGGSGGTGGLKAQVGTETAQNGNNGVAGQNGQNGNIFEIVLG